MTESQLKVAYLTAGAAGMYCGSCMHDNTLAASLSRLDVDIQLIPCYTPIRTDEHDVSIDRIFFGGVNVYLQQKIPLFRYVPSLLDRFLDAPWLLRKVTSRASRMDYRELGALTVSMLRGEHGNQRKEVRRLCRWLASSVHPNLVALTNILIAGCVPEIKRTLNVPVLVSLQGDDVFLDEIPEPHRSRAFDEIRRIVPEIDGFIVNSQYYADYMLDYFSIPRDRIHIVPLGIDTDSWLAFQNDDDSPTIFKRGEDRPTIGYLARLAPEKGLQVLTDAFIELRKRPEMQQAELSIAGWLGEHHREFAESQFEKLREAGLGDAFRYAGSVDREGKIQFLRELDVLSVPTTYRDPKGLFVLEAMAAGVPVVQPNHGAFPEMLEATGGGVLVEPGNPVELANRLHQVLTDAALLTQLRIAGRAAVHQRFNATTMADATRTLFERFALRNDAT